MKRASPEWLFCFGSNNPAQLSDRLGLEVEPVGAWVANMGRAFRGMSRTWGGGTATLLKMPGVSTYGYVVALDKSALQALDRFEGVPVVYQREKIAVTTQDGVKLKAWAYISQRKEFNPPTQAYLKAVAKTISVHWRGASGKAVSWKDVPIR